MKIRPFASQCLVLMLVPATCGLAFANSVATLANRQSLDAIIRLFSSPSAPVCGALWYPKDHPRVFVRFYISKTAAMFADTLHGYVLVDDGRKGVPDSAFAFRNDVDWRKGTPLPFPRDRADRLALEEGYAEDIRATLEAIKENEKSMPAVIPPCP